MSDFQRFLFLNLHLPHKYVNIRKYTHGNYNVVCITTYIIYTIYLNHGLKIFLISREISKKQHFASGSFFLNVQFYVALHSKSKKFFKAEHNRTLYNPTRRSNRVVHHNVVQFHTKTCICTTHHQKIELKSSGYQLVYWMEFNFSRCGMFNRFGWV